MRQPCAVEIIVPDEEGVEHLRLPLKSTKSSTVQNTIPINLKRRAVFVRRSGAGGQAFGVELGIESIHGIEGGDFGFGGRHVSVKHAILNQTSPHPPSPNPASYAIGRTFPPCTGGP